MAETTEQLEAASRRKLELICEACQEIKALDLKALDVRGQTPLADYFVICTGTSDTHIKSIAENAQDKLREDAKVRAKPQGSAQSFWIVLDYGDVILHIFDEETRNFYDLERLWSDAKEIDCSAEGDAAEETGNASEEIAQ